MTTEIAVVNRLGVALATDSAVTISGGGGMKVFDTADKLFELSDYHPVAIMINGSMDFHGVPWEIFVKAYRTTESDASRRSVEEWARSFLKFVEGHPSITPQAIEVSVRRVAYREAAALQSMVRSELFRAASARDDVDEEQIGVILRRAIKQRTERFASQPFADSHKSVSLRNVQKEYGPLIREVMRERFPPYELSASELSALVRLVARALVTSIPSEFGAGLIVAGYGDEDLFPSLVGYDVDGIVMGTLKCTRSEAQDIDRLGELGAVISFAQTDVIDRLLEGADERFVTRSAQFFENVLTDLGDKIVAALSKAAEDDEQPGERTRAVKEAFEQAAQLAGKKYSEEFSRNLRKELRRDFNRMVAMMPKQDVIELAEALVSITAVERKASSDTATVGGPIDVAIITKHEGFVWVKRKHFFNAELNPRYLWRKYGTGRTMEGSNEAAERGTAHAQ